MLGRRPPYPVLSVPVIAGMARSSPAFGIILLIHPSAVVLTFAASPYGKFTRVFYRFAALLRDNLERLELAEREHGA